jgi:hypothetical protein
VESLRLPSRSTFQTDFLRSQPFRDCFNVGSCPKPEINCYMGHYVQTMISDKPEVRQDEELESHLNKRQFVVGFVPLQFCLCFFFFKSRVYINHQRTLQGQHPCRNCEHTRCYVMANTRNGLIHLFSVSHEYLINYAFKYVNCLQLFKCYPK